jgi:hypothetical protein
MQHHLNFLPLPHGQGSYWSKAMRVFFVKKRGGDRYLKLRIASEADSGAGTKVALLLHNSIRRNPRPDRRIGSIRPDWIFFRNIT